MLIVDVLPGPEALKNFNDFRNSPAGIYFLKAPEQYVKPFQSKQKRHQKDVDNVNGRLSGVFIVNLGQISNFALLFPLLTLNR